MRKLIALDIDGTLYNDKKEITPLTKASLIRVQEEGSILVLASGRPTAGLIGIAEKLEMKKHHGLLLAYNGGVVMDYSNGTIIYDNTIPIHTAKKLLRHLEMYPVTPVVDDGYSIYTNEPEGFQIPYESNSNNLLVKEVHNISDAVDFSPAKVLIAAPEEILSQYMQDITSPFLNVLSFIRSAPFYLEATPLGVNKADSMWKVCEKLNIGKEDVIAFGDAENDISMIEFAGTGVAMGNACTALKEIADMITNTNNEDGIAAALDKLGIT